MKNSIFNSVSNVIVNLSSTIFSFIVRTIFIKILGQELLGLDGLFTNILSLLSLAELGFSTAISFSLYEPLAKNNMKKVNDIIIYLKKVYRFIFFFIMIGGLFVIPFLPIIIKGYPINNQVYIIYLLYLINTAVTYLFSYSSILIEADQKNYKLVFIRLSFDAFTYIFQILSLLLFKSFILYLLVQLIIRFIQRIVTYIYVAKYYPLIDFKLKSKINDEDHKVIQKNIKGIIFHKVGDYAVNGTDNILISSLVNISVTGIYSNYLAIVSVFKNFISTIITSTTSSFGNLNVTENCKTKENVFNLLNFMTMIVTGVITIGIYYCVNNLISIWLGENYLLNQVCIIFICINLYLASILQPVNTVKNSAGLYYIDRYISIIQGIINLVISIVLGVKIGILGILLGTTISSILTVNITKPYIIYKYVFNSNPIKYYTNLLKNILIIILTIVIGNILIHFVSINNLLIQLIFKGLIGVGLYIILFILFNLKTNEFQYFKNMLIKNKKEV